MDFKTITPSKVNILGIIQVCQSNGTNSPNEWVMVCRDSDIPLNRDGVSHAVCRQFGFIGAAANISQLR